MLNKRLVWLMLVCLLAVFAVAPIASAKITGGDILKVVGIGFLVDQFAKPLNNFINTLTLNHNVGTTAATKVVPIISFGDGTHIGAAQVTGPTELVEKVKAVGQLEGEFHRDQFRIKVLIPIDNLDPRHWNRVEGVGVSAVIDVKV